MSQCAQPYSKIADHQRGTCLRGRVFAGCAVGGFLGTSILYALLQLVLMVEDHEAKLQAMQELWQRQTALTGVAVNASDQRGNGTQHAVLGATPVESVQMTAQLEESMVPTANVAMGAPVRVSGGRVSGAPTANLFDGEFVPDGTGWNAPENVWWTDPNVVFNIDLWDYSCVTGVIVQADCNDYYKILLDGQLIADVLPCALHGNGGVTTWPFPNVAAMVPFTCGMSLTFFAHGGDNKFGVQEISLLGFRSTDSSQQRRPLVV